MSIKNIETIENIISSLYFDLKEKLSSRKEISMIKFIDDFNKLKKTKYFEIFLKESYLNDLDIDLFDIEIEYILLSDDLIEIKGEFYGADGKIFKTLYLKSNDLLVINNELEKFIINIIKCYNLVIPRYLNENNSNGVD